MQELLEWIRTTLPMDLETPRMIEQKIESMLEKEKEAMCEFAFRFNHDAFNENYIKAEFEETFNTKEK